MTQRQEQIAEMVARGMSNREIGMVLGLAERTIKYQLTMLYDQLGLSNRMRLVVWWRNHEGTVNTLAGVCCP